MPRLVVTFDWAAFVHLLRSSKYLDCTQEELARRLEVSVSSVSNWERGVVTPQPRHRRRLRRLAIWGGLRRKYWPYRKQSLDY